MNPPAFTLRIPGPADAAGLADLHVETWRETYGSQMPASAFDDAARAARLEMWQGTLNLPNPAGTLQVAEAAGKLIGFAGAMPSKDREAVRDLHLRMLYVLADFHGTGAGQQLLDAVIGDSPALLWVAEDNLRARRFYERNGFAADGAQEEMMGLIAVRMVR